jgi:hypothetical protein
MHSTQFTHCLQWKSNTLRLIIKKQASNKQQQQLSHKRDHTNWNLDLIKEMKRKTDEEEAVSEEEEAEAER